MNSAAKFWPGLLEEVLACFPACVRIELSFLSADALDGTLLHPTDALAAELESDAHREPAREWQRLIEDLELAGPPAAVHVRLLAATACLYDDILPEEIVDAEIFMYLLAWLLTWAGVPEALWQQAHLRAALQAEDLRRRQRYELAFELQQTAAAEGLISRVLDIQATLARSA